MTRILVCGGREFDDVAFMHRVLKKYVGKDDIICTGAAKGADLMAEAWARRHEIAYMGVPAKWWEQGRSAGPIRNKRMLKLFKPDLVLAFPGGTGTANMEKISVEAGVEVVAP